MTALGGTVRSEDWLGWGESFPPHPLVEIASLSPTSVRVLMGTVHAERREGSPTPRPVGAADPLLVRRNWPQEPLVGLIRSLSRRRYRAERERAEPPRGRPRRPETAQAKEAAADSTEDPSGEKDACVVCLVSSPEVRFWPCKHEVCCWGCAAGIRKKCPLCRATIDRETLLGEDEAPPEVAGKGDEPDNERGSRPASPAGPEEPEEPEEPRWQTIPIAALRRLRPAPADAYPPDDGARPFPVPAYAYPPEDGARLRPVPAYAYLPDDGAFSSIAATGPLFGITLSLVAEEP